MRVYPLVRQREGRWPGLAGPLCLLAGSWGCGAPGVVERLDSFHAQVHEVLRPDSTRSGYRGSGRFFPRLRERRLEARDERIGVISFLSLQGCRLGELAGYRNSQLGRVMVGTRRLAYEIEVAAVGVPCAVELEDDERRAELLALLERKQEELPVHVWNAVWTDSPLAAYLSSEASPRPGEWGAYGTSALASARRSLSRLGTLEDAQRIEEALGELRAAAPGGALLRALDHVRHDLRAIAVLLGQVSAAECNGASRRLGRIFQSTYPGIQAEIVRLDREAWAVLEELEGIYAATAARIEPPTAMARYAAERLDTVSEGSLWGSYRRATRQHAEAWGPLLSACQLIPAS